MARGGVSWQEQRSSSLRLDDPNSGDISLILMPYLHGSILILMLRPSILSDNACIEIEVCHWRAMKHKHPPSEGITCVLHFMTTAPAALLHAPAPAPAATRGLGKADARRPRGAKAELHPGEVRLEGVCGGVERTVGGRRLGGHVVVVGTHQQRRRQWWRVPPQRGRRELKGRRRRQPQPAV